MINDGEHIVNYRGWTLKHYFEPTTGEWQMDALNSLGASIFGGFTGPVFDWDKVNTLTLRAQGSIDHYINNDSWQVRYKKASP